MKSMRTDHGQLLVVHGDGARLDVVATGEAQLVFTGPPYFPAEIEPELGQPLRHQTDYHRVRDSILSFTESLGPVFQEAHRVLADDGFLVTYMKDIRYGPHLIPLVARHRLLLEDEGFTCVANVVCRRIRRQSPLTRFRRRPAVGGYRSDDLEDILVFTKGPAAGRGPYPEPLKNFDVDALGEPYWVITPLGRSRIHPHQMPAAVAERMIQLYSKPGDLVVDPFCGSGTTLLSAARLGRRAVGYELDGERAELVHRRIRDIRESGKGAKA